MLTDGGRGASSGDRRRGQRGAEGCPTLQTGGKNKNGGKVHSNDKDLERGIGDPLCGPAEEEGKIRNNKKETPNNADLRRTSRMSGRRGRRMVIMVGGFLREVLLGVVATKP